jgi:hypothetical protein
VNGNLLYRFILHPLCSKFELTNDNVSLNLNKNNIPYSMIIGKCCGYEEDKVVVNFKP